MASDADTGIGIGTPITPAGAPDSHDFIPPVRTILPLGEYARIMGINPIQFWSGIHQAGFPPTYGADRWLAYSWQDGEKVSREELAREILRAERDIAAELRYWPGPVWTEDEEVAYPQYYRKGYVGQFGHDANRRMKTVNLLYGKFIEGGKRTVSLVGTATTAASALQYIDNDSDGYDETAKITLATTLTDPCEIKLYHSGHAGKPEWEIRPLKSATIESGFFVATCDAWLLFKPSLLAAFPGSDGFDWLDATVSTNYVTEVDAYREYADPSEMATLLWEGSSECTCSGAGCPICGFDSQAACFMPRDALQGLVAPVPGTYDAAADAWTFEAFTNGYDPHKLTAAYLSGIQEDDHNGCGLMPQDLALAVTYMATARLARPLCTHSEVLRKREEELKEDLIFITKGGDATRFVTREVLNCPFGTRYGELEAWRIVRDRLDIGEMKVDVAIV